MLSFLYTHNYNDEDDIMTITTSLKSSEKKEKDTSPDASINELGGDASKNTEDDGGAAYKNFSIYIAAGKLRIDPFS